MEVIDLLIIIGMCMLLIAFRIFLRISRTNRRRRRTQPGLPNDCAGPACATCIKRRYCPDKIDRGDG